jgi:uncharacterized protein (TIRG00374 family)
MVLVTVLVVELVAVRLLADARESWPPLGSAAPMLLVLGLVLELASLAAFSRLTILLLPGERPSYRTVLAIDVTGKGFSHVVPGGGASAAALRFGLLARVRVPPDESVGAAALQYAVTALWMVVVLVLGLVVAVPVPQTHALVRTASVLAVVVVAFLGGILAVLMVRPDQVVTVTHAAAGRLPWVHPETLERVVRGLIDQVHLVLTSRQLGRRALVWSGVYWVLDAASLYVSVWAFGPPPNPGGVLTTYALVSLLALLPLTPGGLGLVEGVAVPLLVSFGTPQGASLLGVLTWRLFAFWLTIPLGLGAFLWLRSSVLRRRPGTLAG